MDGQGLAIRQRQEVRQRPRDDPQVVVVQLEVANNPGVQQSHGIARRRIAEPGVEFLGYGGSTDH